MTIQWLGARLPKSRGAGYGESALPLSALLQKEHRPAGMRDGFPTVIYFYTSKNDDKLLQFDAKVFGDERVGVSSRFFNCVRISLDEMTDAEREQYGGSEPAVFVLDASGALAKKHLGWGTVGANLFKTLEVVFKDRYGLQLAGLLAKEGKILDTLDKVYWDLKDKETELSSVNEHLAKHDCERGRRELKEVQEEIAQLEQQRKKALEEEKALLSPEPKPAGESAAPN
jgi:hypothetical protein